MQTLPQAIVVHRFFLSGHCHKVELFLSLLGLPSSIVEVDLVAGAHRAPAFLAKNAFGQVPVIEDGATTIADSNAILVYLATRYDPKGTWLPREPLALAEVQRWLSIAAGPLASGPATARVARLFGKPDDENAKAIATKLFAVMDAHLASRPYLAGSSPTIADVAVYSYTRHAPEGGVELEPFTHVVAWLGRIEALPGFVPLTKGPGPAA